uniref:LIM zinc-binding domain-containing protein n=1 Tax=Cyprinus carpio TaxID=7962 RepID=A0A8C2EJQ1_CYPCA
MNPACARCGKTVYPTEKISCLDKNWHKGCFHCEVCKMTLNMKNYKGYDKKPYCNAHYPKTSFTIVTDTPENLRLKQQSELQSQVRYKRDFEESKGRGFSIVTDTPELQRLRRTQDHISNVKYHEEFERSRGRGATHTLDEQHMARLHGDQLMGAGDGYHGVQPQVVEMDRRSAGAAELKVWRTDPGSIFDFDPVEDNIQSKSLRRMTGTADAQLYTDRQPRGVSVCNTSVCVCVCVRARRPWPPADVCAVAVQFSRLRAVGRSQRVRLQQRFCTAGPIRFRQDHGRMPLK